MSCSAGDTPFSDGLLCSERQPVAPGDDVTWPVSARAAPSMSPPIVTTVRAPQRSKSQPANRARRERRTFARQCLDWSERRVHLAGALGAAVARCCADLRWVHPLEEERTLTLTRQGQRGLRTWFGIGWKR